MDQSSEQLSRQIVSVTAGDPIVEPEPSPFNSAEVVRDAVSVECD
jgi:hypothetical protein